MKYIKLKFFSISTTVLIVISCSFKDENDYHNVKIYKNSNGGNGGQESYSNPPETGGNHGGLECNNGEERTCHILISTRQGVNSCFLGHQYCFDKKWSPCN
jgi:hypothetical protein